MRFVYVPLRVTYYYIIEIYTKQQYQVPTTRQDPAVKF